MTIEQKTEIKRICGILEEAASDLGDMKAQLEKEWDDMSGDEQAENMDLDSLIYDIEELQTGIDIDMDKVIERMEAL